MPRQRKTRPEAIILPPELDDDDEEAGSVIPDDEGWIAVEGTDGPSDTSGRDPGDGAGVRPRRRLANGPAKRRAKRPR